MPRHEHREDDLVSLPPPTSLEPARKHPYQLHGHSGAAFAASAAIGAPRGAAQRKWVYTRMKSDPVVFTHHEKTAHAPVRSHLGRRVSSSGCVDLVSHLQKSGVGVGWQTLVCIFRGESNRQVAFQRRVRRQAVCHSAPWLESEYDAACRCDAKDGPVPVPAGRARIAGDRWQESGRFQFSRRSNWSTVSASTPNIRWHSTLE